MKIELNLCDKELLEMLNNTINSVEFTENHVDMRREVTTCSLIECPKSRGKHTITERCWRY